MESDLDLGIGYKQCSSDSLVLQLVLLADDKAPFKDNQEELAADFMRLFAKRFA